MTEQELIKLFVEPLYENFVEQTARRFVSEADLEQLYALVTTRNEHLPQAVRHKVFFRGAYVLEWIYFEDPSRFTPFAERFFRSDFAACTDASARRHFTKIMTHLLGCHAPGRTSLERIADAAGEWAVDPRAKVAVRIGAVEVLKRCRDSVGWVDESWEDLLAAMEHDATPGIRCRMRKSWR